MGSPAKKPDTVFMSASNKSTRSLPEPVAELSVGNGGSGSYLGMMNEACGGGGCGGSAEFEAKFEFDGSATCWSLVEDMSSIVFKLKLTLLFGSIRWFVETCHEFGSFIK